MALTSSSLFLVHELAQSAHLILRAYIRQRHFSIEQYRIVKFININRYIENGRERLHHDNKTCSHFVVVSGRLFPPLIRFIFLFSLPLSPSICLYIHISMRVSERLPSSFFINSFVFIVFHQSHTSLIYTVTIYIYI